MRPERSADDGPQDNDEQDGEGQGLQRMPVETLRSHAHIALVLMWLQLISLPGNLLSDVHQTTTMQVCRSRLSVSDAGCRLQPIH